MISKLEKIKETLEFYANPDSWKHPMVVRMEAVKGQAAEQALAELKEVMDRLKSDELPKEIGGAIRVAERGMIPLSCGSMNGSEILAQAAINTITGKENGRA